MTILSIFYDANVTKVTRNRKRFGREYGKKLIKILKKPIVFEIAGAFCYNINRIAFQVDILIISILEIGSA